MLALENKNKEKNSLRIALAHTNSFQLCRTAGRTSEVSKSRGGKVEDLPAEGEAAYNHIFVLSIRIINSSNTYFHT